MEGRSDQRLVRANWARRPRSTSYRIHRRHFTTRPPPTKRQDTCPVVWVVSVCLCVFSRVFSRPSRPFSGLPIPATALTVRCDTVPCPLGRPPEAWFHHSWDSGLPVPRDSFSKRGGRLSDRQSIGLSCRSTRQSICKSAILWVAGHEGKVKDFVN